MAVWARTIFLLLFMAGFVPACTSEFLAHADGPELIQSIGIFEDSSGTLRFDDVRNQTFLPAGRVISKGYSHSKYWLKLRIMPSNVDNQVVLTVRPHMIDDISLFVPVDGRAGHWAEKQLGSRGPATDEEWASSLRGFRIDPQPGGSVYYLRLSSTGSLIAFITATASNYAYLEALRFDLLQITYLALMAVLMVWALRMFALTRGKLFGNFALLQAVWIVHNMLWFGYGGLLVSAPFAAMLWFYYRIIVILVSMLTIAFHRAVLIRFAPHRYAIRSLDLLMLIMGTAFVLFWTYDYTVALAVNAMAVALSPAAFLANAFTARRNASPGLRLLRIAYVLLSFSLSLWVLSLFGGAGGEAQAYYGPMIHGTATGLLMFTILHVHGQKLFRQFLSARAIVTENRRRRAYEENNNRILRRMFDMLSHETKNGLAVISLTLSAPTFGERQRERVATAIKSLGSIIDRCTQVTQLDTRSQEVASEICDPASILRTICQNSNASDRIEINSPESLAVRSDPVLLHVILTNLIENAEKYSDPTSTIRVRMFLLHETRLDFEIENEACASGLPDSALIFQKYYRSSCALSQIGSGLGLYLVHGLVRILGGSITYDPCDNRVRFRFWIPC